jgi:alpha-L-fucosidase
MMNRRQLLKAGGACGGLVASGSFACCKSKLKVPSYLKQYEELYATDPRQAALTWFKEAQFGLFLHYGLYSLLEGHYKGEHSKPAEWVLFRTAITLSEYEKLTEEFTAEKFDADFITDMALNAGMKYINITTRHHDSFCLWDTNESEYKSTNSAAKRDLVAELAQNCRKKSLGLCLYYSHGRDWRHRTHPAAWHATKTPRTWIFRNMSTS